MIFRLLVTICLLFLPALSSAGEGLLDLTVEAESGKVILQLDEFPAEFIHVPALQTGVGSNDLGLDRGQMGPTRLVRFERYGNRVLLLEPNLRFRADSNNAAERRAVEEAFAQSVLAGFPIENPGGNPVRIDLTPFLLSDIRRLGEQISELGQGNYEVDPERSAVDSRAIRVFQGNALIPVVLTFKGSPAGSFVRDVTPTPDSLTLRVVHQFVEVPDSDYRTRAFHPRSGYFGLHYLDYAAPLEQPIEKRLIYRHALEPGSTLTYYVDNGTPEPVRSALLEGASWWDEAFAASGSDIRFEVDVLPEDADPLDVRYNVIQWVHRSTRGWSYGGSVADPRTGEIIKGHVSLGSLRVRQDQLIAEALTAPFTEPDASADAARNMALARLRQLSAHEVGHTLGIDHNFGASFSGDASVMDYPHPNLYLDDSGRVRLDRAYASGVSPWDKLVIRYGYAHFAPGEEQQGLRTIVDEGRRAGIAYFGDRDARAPGSAHPGAHLWDNGSDVLQRLNELMAIRSSGLQRFSPDVLPAGTPLFELERRLVPVFLLHRYQLEAAAKLLGGLNYEYTLKGEPESVLKPVAAASQRAALDSLTRLLEPEQLALPPSLHYLIPPPVLEFERDREFFPGLTGTSFDHLAPSRAAADLVIRELLQPQRLARLLEQEALDPELPGAGQTLEALLKVSWDSRPNRDPYLQAIQQEVQWRVLHGLSRLASDSSAGDRVRALGTAALIGLADRLESEARRGNTQARAARQEIQQFLNRPMAPATTTPDPAPPGSPIG